MKFMLDTNICIYIIKQRPESVLERFASHPVGDIGLSVITLAELEYGVSKSGNPSRNREALELFASPLKVAAFDRPATVAYGKLRALLDEEGPADRVHGHADRRPCTEPRNPTGYQQQ